MVRCHHVMTGEVFLFLFLFIIAVLAFTSGIRVESYFVERLIATGGHARVCFLECRQSGLLGALGSRYQIFD